MADSVSVIRTLNQHFIAEYPLEAALLCEQQPPDKAVELLRDVPGELMAELWRYLTLDQSELLLQQLPEATAQDLLQALEPFRCAALLRRLESALQERYLGLLEAQSAAELRTMMAYPIDSAGYWMDPRIMPLRPAMTVHNALRQLRRRKPKSLRELMLVDEQGKPAGRVEFRDLALASPDQPLSALAQRIPVVVEELTPRNEVVERFEQYKMMSLPVVDALGRLIGVIRQPELVAALQEEVSLDIQTMVGVSKDERALSPVRFAVVKRLPWLHINLLTAFMAASVVGLFEGTIARFTALAVLLPVVAGQSGNAGAQSLAVCMRGLALREISLRDWRRMVNKEVMVGLLNGLAVAFTTAVGTYVWSRSLGLALVIGSSMVIAMIAAGFSGALIPILLRRFGQDPAQSSSIILTTVTDVVGFFAFLGIATALAGLL